MKTKAVRDKVMAKMKERNYIGPCGGYQVFDFSSDVASPWAVSSRGVTLPRDIV